MAGERTFKIRIVGTSADAERALDRVRHSAHQLDLSATTLGHRLGGLAKMGLFAVGAAAAVGAYAIGRFAVDAVQAAEAAKKVDRGLASVVQSMGLFGGQTDAVVERLKAYAAQMGVNIGVDDEAIKQVQTKLATFAALAASADQTGGAFDRATQAAFDLASAGFGEAATNAVQLGKALQDPIKGITALARAGVTFTAAEREKIKALVESNRLTEAQGMILAAVEKQVGGHATATATATAKLSAAWEEVKESIGSALLPTVERLANYVTAHLIPAFEAWWKENGDEVARNVEDIADKIITEFIPALKDAWHTAQTELFPAFENLTRVWREDVAPALDRVGQLLDSLTGRQGESAGKASGLATVMRIMSAVVTVTATAWGTLAAILNFWCAQVEWAKGVVARFTTELWAVVQTVKAQAAALIAAGGALIDGFVGAVQRAWAFAASWFGGLGGRVVAAVGSLASTLTGRGASVIGGLWDGIRNRWTGVADWLGGVGTRVVNSVGGLGGKLVDAGRALIDGLARGMRERLTGIIDTAKQIVQAAIDAAKAVAGIRSPSRVFARIGGQLGDGLSVGMDESRGGVAASAGGMLGAAIGAPTPLGRRGGGNTINVTINAGLGTNPRELGAAVVDAIRAYERSSGAVFAAA